MLGDSTVAGHVPSRTIARPHLVARIERGIVAPITVVRAGGGAGKTTLLTEWARSHSAARHVWLTVDDRSSGRLAFWAGVVAAVGAAGVADIRAAAKDVTVEASPPADLVETMASLFAQLGEPLVLVLDDFHRIGDDEVAEDLLAVLRRAPRLRLLVGTRVVSALEDPLVKVTHSPTVIEGDALAFSLDETSGVASAEGVTLTDEQVHEVQKTVSGWALGVRLMLTQLEPAADPDAVDVDSAAHTLTDWVRARLLPRLEEHGTLDTALRMSVAERMTPGLSDRLALEPSASAHLEWLELHGLGERGTDGSFRLHAFVREVLEREFEVRDRRGIDHDRRILATWANETGDIPTAIRQSSRLRDWPLLSTIARRHFGPIVRLYAAEMSEALARVPARDLRNAPILLTTLALLLNTQATTTADRLRSLAAIASSLLKDRLVSGSDSERVWLLVCRMAMERLVGAHDQAARTGDDVLALLPQLVREPDDGLDGTISIVELQVATSLFYVGRHSDAAPLLRHLGATAAPWRAVHALALDVLITAMRGDMNEVETALQPMRARRSPTGWRGTYSATGYHLAEAMSHLERFDTVAARTEVAALDRHRPTIEHWPLLLRMDGLIALAESDAFTGSQHLAAAIAQRKMRSTSTAMSALVAATRADLLTAAGQTQRARQLLSSTRVESRLPLARIALADAHNDRAITLVESLVWEGAELPRSQAEALLVKGVALARLSAPEAGWPAVKDALAVMDRSGLRRPLMMVPRDELRAILSTSPDIDGDVVLAGVPDPFGRAAVIPRLSTRERDVLRQLVVTSSVSDIAGALFVSSNTVKSQLRSIYRKLGVTSREQAIRVAYERGLVDAGETS